MSKIIVSVTNDLTTDQRVHRICSTLHSENNEVLLVGRHLKNSLAVDDREYMVHRFRLVFNKGPLFYLEYSVRLFFYLLRKRADVYLSNDLDTLLPNYLASRLKSVKIVYDSHEYFTGVPELISHPIKRWIWKTIEQNIFPKLRYVYTVNQSIARLYIDEYKVDIKVVRNVPATSFSSETLSRKEMGLPLDRKIIILQGAGINIDRGGEEAVEAMQYIDNAVLLIVGSGDVIEYLHELRERFHLQDKVIFVDKVPLEELVNYTRNSDIGLTLDKPTSINYQLSLPNKIFDYLQARIPVLASNLVEVSKVVNDYQVGEVIENHNPKEIAAKINEMLNDEEKMTLWKENARKAAAELCWEREEEIVKEIFRQVA